MNRKLSFLAVLTVIVAIFAVTSLVFAAPAITRADSTAEFVVGKTATLTVTSGSSIQWYKSEASDGSSPVAVGTRNSDTLTITVDEGSFFYFAEVDGVESDIVKVTGYNPVTTPLVLNFSDDTYIEEDSSADLTFEYDDEVNATVAKVVAKTGDPHVVMKNFGVDMSIYKMMAIKFKPSKISDNPYMFHAYNGTKGAVSLPIFGGYPGTSLPSIGNKAWQVMSYSIPEKEGLHTYSGGRFDFYNGSPAVGDSMYIQYIAAFTDAEQMKNFLNTETVAKTPIDGKFFEFDDDANLAQDFLPDAGYTKDAGVNFDSFTDYTAYLKSMDKFDLAKYSVVKINYTATADAVLSLTYKDLSGNTITKDIDLPASAKSAVADFTDDADWKGEFVELSFQSDSAVTISSIGFVKTNYDAKRYDGNEKTPVSATTEIEYDSAIWWNFADTNILHNIIVVNGDKKFNTNTASGLNTVTLTAEAAGNLSFTYRKAVMSPEHRFEASEYPYVILGYKSASLEGKKAYIKFWTDRNDAPTTVSFVLDGATAPLLLATDDNGYNQLGLNLSSLASIKAIDATAANEFRGEVDAIEFGFEANAGDEIEIAYISFFNDSLQANKFDGDVIVPPQSITSATWKSRSVVKAEYITVRDMDLSEAVVNFDISDYSRISRITLQDLKRDYGAKKIVANGKDYYYEFYPKSVLTNLKTWYYDLEVDFNEKRGSDVYRSIIKDLVADGEIGEYVGGAHFVQKFMKDRSLPFRGKLYYTMGEEFEGKYIDVYTYDPEANALVLSEHAPVTNGKLVLSTLGGDLAFVDSGYAPSEEELAHAAAIEAYENTPWDAYIYNAGDIKYTANNANVSTITENGITFTRTSSTSAENRVETIFYPDAFEASEYPVVVIKYKTGTLTGAVNNYVSTDFYTGSQSSDNFAGYTWFKAGAWYSAGNVYGQSADWVTKVVDYTDKASMNASGFSIGADWVDGAGADRNAVAYPFKGIMNYFRIDYNMSAANTNIDVAYIAFFKTAEEAKKYAEARDIVENVEVQAAIAEKLANMPKSIVFDLTDPKETLKYTFHTPNDTNSVATQSKNTTEGYWTKDSDQEYNLSRALASTETINLKEYPVLKIKYKASIPGITQFYVWQNNQSGNPRADLTFDKAGEWVEQIWDFSGGAISNGTWDGSLLKFRIDPMRNPGGERECTIAYIGFFVSVEEAEAYTGK